MPRKRKQANQMARWASPDDIAMFLDICDCISSSKSSPTLQGIAKQTGRPLSTVSQCLARLEARYRCELIERGARVGVGGLTPDGRRYKWLFEKARKALNDIEEGRAAEDRKTIRIVTTNSLRNFLLVGPVSAHVMRLRIAGVGDKYQVRVDEKDYPDIVRSLREGKYPYAIGWELGENWYQDLEMKERLYDAVPFGAIMGHPQVRGRDDDGLALLFGVREEMRWLEENGADAPERDWGPISVDRLENELNGATVAVLKTEYDKTLQRLPYRARVKDILRFNHYEDIIASIRMGLADLAWVPAFYRDRRQLHFRRLVDKKNGQEASVSRSVVVYRHNTGNKPKPKPAAEALLETVKAFLQAEEFVGRDTRTWDGLSASIFGAKRIGAQEVEAWVRRTWPPKGG